MQGIKLHPYISYILYPYGYKNTDRDLWPMKYYSTGPKRQLKLVIMSWSRGRAVRVGEYSTLHDDGTLDRLGMINMISSLG